MITVEAPAKVNLTLEVLGKRADGYHEIRSLMQTVGLCDQLHFTTAIDTLITSDMPGWDADKSLVSKTLELVREVTGRTDGVKVDVEKRIPLVSGLGGDSSDAAAVLRGLARLWGLELAETKLLEMAARLGSDVAFFLHGGTALCEGRGEVVTPLPPLPQAWIVLLMPSVPRQPGKTQRAYAGIMPDDYTTGQHTSEMVKSLKAGKKVVAKDVINVFERAAFAGSPEIAGCRRRMLAAGAEHVHLAGSGPALFTLVDNKTIAERIYMDLQHNSKEAYLIPALPALERLE